jgi:hypothetical protein
MGRSMWSNRGSSRGWTDVVIKVGKTASHIFRNRVESKPFTFSNRNGSKLSFKQGMVAHVYNPSYLGFQQDSAWTKS